MMEQEKNMETETDKSFNSHNHRHQPHVNIPQQQGYVDGTRKCDISDASNGCSSGGNNSGSDSGSREIINISSHCGNNNNNNNNNEVLIRNGQRIFGQDLLGGNNRATPLRAMDDGVIGIGGRSGRERENDDGGCPRRPSRACPSPVSAIVGLALNQMHLKRSSSAPMINQLGIGNSGNGNGNGREISGGIHCASPTTPMSGLVNNSLGSHNKESIADIDASALASSFLSSLGGPRPRRFSASFSPGSPGLAPNRVSQLRQENITDWETMSEKEFHGTQNIAQSWEDLSLDSMSMEVGTRRPSISDQLWLSMPTSSAPSSPAASPRVLSRFSPSLSSPSPTRKSFTTRRSLSPIAVRPSVLSIGQGVKRKCDWDSNSSIQMDCSPQPAKRHVGQGLLGFNNAGSPVSQYSSSGGGGGSNNYGFIYNNTTGTVQQPFFPNLQNQPSSSSGGTSGTSPFNPNNSSTSSSSLMSMITNHVEDSPFSNETESSVSSIGGCDSPFFRPVDSPLASVTASPEDSSQHLSLPKT